MTVVHEADSMALKMADLKVFLKVGDSDISKVIESAELSADEKAGLLELC